MEEQSPKYRLYSGCWNGTLTSRDFGVETFETEEAAREYFTQAKINWARIGYRPWGTCKIVRPDGSEVVLSQ